MLRRHPLPIALVLGWTISSLAWAQPTKLPEGPGLSAMYPGDVGIEKAASVVFVENFEHASLTGVTKRWESVTAPDMMSLASDRPAASGGKKSLLVQHVGGKGDNVYLYRRLEPGYDQLFVRFYVKFAEDCAPIHHFFHIGGYRPSTPWPQGGAGVRPRGDQRFTLGIEPFGEMWAWDAYAYWCEMGGSPPRGQTWGNNFLGPARPKVNRGTWTCIEGMIRLNDPDDHNGELALWVDGKLVGHFGKGFPRGKRIFDKFLPGAGGDGVRWNDATGKPEPTRVAADGEPFAGIRWRTDAKLKINFLWLLNFITRAKPGQVSRIGFDDVVVAREYIGPLMPAQRE